MPIASSRAAEIVQAGRDTHDQIGQTIYEITELIFRDAADFDPGNRMFSANAHPRQFAVPALLARFQLFVLGLFFGWRCACTGGA